MGLKDLFGNFIPSDDGYEDEEELYQEGEAVQEEETTSAPSRFFARRSAKADREDENSGARPQVQVVLVKPTSFDDATTIADHLNAHKTVVLNMESASADVKRRLLDFLSGSAYSNGAGIQQVAKSTYIITPAGVNVLGNLIANEFPAENFFG